MERPRNSPNLPIVIEQSYPWRKLFCYTSRYIAARSLKVDLLTSSIEVERFVVTLSQQCRFPNLSVKVELKVQTTCCKFPRYIFNRLLANTQVGLRRRPGRGYGQPAAVPLRESAARWATCCQSACGQLNNACRNNISPLSFNREWSGNFATMHCILRKA